MPLNLILVHRKGSEAQVGRGVAIWSQVVTACLRDSVFLMTEYIMIFYAFKYNQKTHRDASEGQGGRARTRAEGVVEALAGLIISLEENLPSSRSHSRWI